MVGSERVLAVQCVGAAVVLLSGARCSPPLTEVVVKLDAARINGVMLIRRSRSSDKYWQGVVSSCRGYLCIVTRVSGTLDSGTMVDASRIAANMLCAVALTR